MGKNVGLNKKDKRSYYGHLYKCISVPEERDRQRTINNICLAFLGSPPKQGNIYDVSAFLLRFSSRNEDISHDVLCAFFSSTDFNFSDNHKTTNIISLTPFAY